MGASESKYGIIRNEFKSDDDDLELLNADSDDHFEKTADYIKSIENENYGRFKLMQFRISKRQFVVIERITSEFRDFEDQCREVDKRLKFNSPQLVRWMRAYKQCNKQYCNSFFKLYISIDYMPYSLKDQLESRKNRSTHCGEKEIFNMIDSVLSALIYLHSNGIQHKFIQPKTILYDQVNHSYQITDIQFLNGGISEYQTFLFGSNSTQPCYLSPELLKSLNHRQYIPKYSISKSDIFSLGLSALEMATMKSVQSVYDFLDFQINEDNLNFIIEEIQTIYSDNLLSVLMKMLTVQVSKRPDFDELANILKSTKPQFVDSTQSMNVSSISEEFNKSGKFNKKIAQNERSQSNNTLKHINNNEIKQIQIVAQQDTQKYHHKNQQNCSNKISIQSVTKNSSMYKDGLNEFEEDNKQNTTILFDGSFQDSYQSPAKQNKNNIYQYQIHNIQPDIQVQKPKVANQQVELHSPIPITNTLQPENMFFVNQTNQNNFKQESKKKQQEDIQLNQHCLNNPINLSINTLQNSSPNKVIQNHQKMNDQIDHFNQQKSQILRSESQHQNQQNQHNIDPIEQEYEEFKVKQRELQMQSKNQIINNEQLSYLQEKNNWQIQQQQYIQDSKKHEDLQQQYIQSQQQGIPLSRNVLKKYSQQSPKSGTKEFQNNLPTYQQNFYLNQNKSSIKSELIYKSPQKINYGKMGNQDEYTVISKPQNSRNPQFRSPYSRIKAPQLNQKDYKRAYTDENEIIYNNRNAGRSLNKHNKIYYNTTNVFNNSLLENSISQNKIDMSMLSNYDIKDIHIKSYKRNENTIQNTLSVLEERIDQIDKSLNSFKKPLRSSSNNAFQFNQNTKILSPISNKKSPHQQKSKFFNEDSITKTNLFNQNYDSHIPYLTPFSYGNYYSNTYKQKF